MDKKIIFRAKTQSIGGSKYILVPAKSVEYEQVDDDTVYTVTLEY